MRPLGPRDVPGTTKPLTARARQLRRDPTDAERRLWRSLRDEPFVLAHFRRQVPIAGFVVDFASHSTKLIVELDSGQHADGEQAVFDVQRTKTLTTAGYRVLRFWNSDVSANLEGVLDTISRALYHPSQPGDRAAATPAPDPSPQGGGE